VAGKSPACSAAIRMGRRIASPGMLPEAEPLPHLICSRPMFIGGVKDEADQHGSAGRVGSSDSGTVFAGGQDGAGPYVARSSTSSRRLPAFTVSTTAERASKPIPYQHGQSELAAEADQPAAKPADRHAPSERPAEVGQLMARIIGTNSAVISTSRPVYQQAVGLAHMLL
jgi:hypothetical protein